MTTQEKQELKDLLFTEANNVETEGLLHFVKRTVGGDRQLAKIVRVKELIEKI